MSGSDVIPLLIECGFRATVPLSMAWAATRMASGSSAATRHFMWVCAIASAVLLPIATIATPRWNIAAPAPVAQLASAVRIDAPLSTLATPAPTKGIGVDAPRRPKDRRLDRSTPWVVVATGVWMTGAVVVFGYVLIGHFVAWRLSRKTRSIQDCWIHDAQQLTREVGLSRALRVVESSAVSVPVVLQLWRPVIVMPSAAGRWSWTRIRAVLLHELAHIKRNDFHTQSLAHFACAAYWFNPLVWFAAHQLQLERERACDDFVLLDGTNGTDYATHLLEIARAASASTGARFAIGLAAPRSQLERRLVAIVNPGTPRHSTTGIGRLIVALATLLVALAAAALQISARTIRVPVGAIKIPAPVIQVHADAAELLTNGTQANVRSMATGSRADGISQLQEFRWAATMQEHQTVELYLGRGSIRVVPSGDDTVRVQARTDDPRHSEIQAVSNRNGVKFCNIVTRARESRNYCLPDQDTSRIPQDQPSTELVIYVPGGLRFAASTVLGNITAEHPSADTDVATIDGNITLKLAPEEGANFAGNLIKGRIDSDFPLIDDTPSLSTGERPAMSAPRMVHAIVGLGGPRFSAMVVNGNIRLLRQAAE